MPATLPSSPSSASSPSHLRPLESYLLFFRSSSASFLASRLRPFSFKCFFMWFRRFVSTYFFPLPLRPTASPSLPPRSQRARTPLLLGSRRNYRVLRFASGLSAGSTGGPSWKPFLSNIQGTRDGDATLPSTSAFAVNAS